MVHIDYFHLIHAHQPTLVVLIEMPPRLEYITIAALCFCGSINAQTNKIVTTAIDRVVQEINQSEDYEVRTLENDEFLEQMTDGGGELTGLMRNGQLVKMIEQVGLSSCVNVTEYYFENSQLAFISVQGSEFSYIDSTSSFDPRAQDVTMKANFYFHANKLIESELKGSTRCGGAPTKEWAAVYQTEALRLKGLLMH
ncbi:MAG: hypothetical protein KF843_13610 [Flavobacteriales bacterium]|nr:hypothetical protein [Flavobacteriales bacterium]